ncbi:MAG: hypothetical protein QOD53_1936 [Thermoleophilaceae bacterium]|jgi:lipoprotein-anchoring transpeptidase ErfK/SrfK|nr:hypothetical protein [Thermoleophilaceae bacterium]MEA2405518.1 hypothetical protein [Thermoleophilaceae bacterium]
MLRFGRFAPLVAILVLATAGLAAVAASRMGANRAHTNGAAPPPAAVPQTPPLQPLPSTGATAPPGPSGAAQRKRKRPSFEIFRVRRGNSVNLRSRPHGRIVARVPAVTEFGSPAALSVAARHGHWVGVPSPSLPNGTLGWLDERTNSASRIHEGIQLVVSLSRRRLELRSSGRVKRTISVGIGRPGSATPRGHFSVTDKLGGGRYGPYYGCCILALSGHQPHPPPGWQGGSRLAIHGTNAPGSIGVPSSAGCMHASERDLRVLMRRVPLGTPVLIRK